MNSGADAVSVVVVGFCRPLGAPDVVKTMAPDAKTLWTIKQAGGCALQCARGCVGKNASAATSQTWRRVPAGAPVKNGSGWSCSPCRLALARQQKHSAASMPSQSTRSKRILSPNRGSDMSPGLERAPPSRRSEGDILAVGGYRQDRPYEPRRDVVDARAKDDDPADVPAIVKSFGAARKFVSDSQPRFQQQIVDYETQHAKLLDKYRRRRQKSTAGPERRVVLGPEVRGEEELRRRARGQAAEGLRRPRRHHPRAVQARRDRRVVIASRASDGVRAGSPAPTARPARISARSHIIIVFVERLRRPKGERSALRAPRRRAGRAPEK